MFKEASDNKKKNDASTSIIDVVQRGIKGLVMAKCQYILVPVLENDHFILAIFALAEGKSKVLKAPAIHEPFARLCHR